MRRRILVVDTTRRPAAVWKAGLAAIDCTIVGPFSSVTRVVPADIGAVDLVVIDGAAILRGGPELLAKVRQQCGASAPLLIATIAAGDQKQRAAATHVGVGADEVLEEPVDKQLMAVSVNCLLRFKAARDELLTHTGELAGARDERRMLAESLGHDLKSPIAVVHVNLAWAIERIGTELPDVAEALTDAQGGLLSMLQVVDDLLMVGMLERARSGLKREDIRVTDLLDQAIKSNELQARARNVSLSISLDQDMRVIGDSAVLRRAVSNMVETSLRHTPSSGRIALSARAGVGVEIEVSSTGRPQAPDDRPRSGEPPPSSTKVSNGGLALYFCRRAVEAHHGKLDVVETAEGPSSVVMRLPSTG